MIAAMLPERTALLKTLAADVRTLDSDQGQKKKAFFALQSTYKELGAAAKNRLYTEGDH